jgi:hypothetical protein
MGFVPHCLAELKVRPLAPLIVDGDPHKGGRQLLEADVVYARDFTRPQNMDGEQWKHLALIAHHCYGSIDLAHRAITAATELGVLRPEAPAQYLNILRSSGAAVTGKALP